MPRPAGSTLSLERFEEFNLDPALAEMAEASAADEILEGILRLENPDEIPPDFKVVSRFNRICTGRFPARMTWEIRRHPNVLSFKAAQPLGIHQESAELAEAVFPGEMPARPPAPFGGRGCIVAALDFGLDFAHPNFLNPDGTTRLVAFWHQGAAYDPAHPNRFGYGRVYSRQEIDVALRTPDPYQALGYHPAVSDTGNGSHGTHTLDIAAGNGQAPAARAGAAPAADLMFVHLSTPRLDVVGDLGDSVRVLEALDFVDGRASGCPWVANLSVGRTAGSHDGTSPVEQGMHELLRRGPGRAIVQSAGNYRSADLAVEGWLRDGEQRDLPWIIDPADASGNEIDAWYAGKDRFVVAIRPPQGEDFVQVRLGEAADLRHRGKLVGRVYHRKDDPNNRDNHIEVFLYPGAPAGTWTVRLVGDYVIGGRFHAWIERDLPRPGAQSRFDARITSRRYTLGTIATSPLVITVGAYDANVEGKPFAPFSSCGPTRDERHDKPELGAPGVAVVAARSIPRWATHQEGLLVARSGTSMAAPHVTGTVAAMFEAAARPVSIDEIRHCLKRSAEPLTDADSADCCAWGRLNAAEAMRRIRGLKEPELLAAPRRYGFAPGPPALTSEEQDVQVRLEEGALMNSEAADSFLEQADDAAGSSYGPRAESETSFLQRLLRELGAGGSAAARSPAQLLREIVRGRAPMDDVLEVLAMPAQRPGAALQAGDWMLRAVPGTGDVGHVAVLASDRLLTPAELASEGIDAESMQPGEYGLVVEARGFRRRRSRRFARKWLDRRGRVPPHTVLLRPRYRRAPVRPRYPGAGGTPSYPEPAPLPDLPPEEPERPEEPEQPDEPELDDIDAEEVGCEGESFDEEGWTGSEEQVAFRDRVLNAHIARSRRRRGEPQRNMRDDELGLIPEIDKKIPTGRETAQAAGRLLAAAKADLAAAQQAGHEDALRTVRLTATSGYRSAESQRELWLKYFREQYYPNTQAARQKCPDGPHSDQAVEYMLKPLKSGGFGLGGRIAAPGYSNHQNGIAIDFKQERKEGYEVNNNSEKIWRARWRNSWFHEWLLKNARTFGFRPIETEEWHWEYRGEAAAAAPVAAAGGGAAKPAGELVRFAQRVLNAAEGERLEDDGDLGRLTREALERFRAKYGLGAGGVLDARTELALAQRALEELARASLFAQAGQRDARTDQALTAFKAARGLPSDPTLDAATRGALADALPSPTSIYLGGKLWTFDAKALPMRVALFCPKAALSQREVDVLVFAHGLLSGCPKPKRVPEGFVTDAPFKLGPIIDGSKRAIVVVVPHLDWENPGGARAFGKGRERWHALAKPENFNRVLAEVLAEVGRVQGVAAPSLRGLVIAGHSRAYDFLEPLAHSHADPQMGQDALARLSQVWAFDTTYAGDVTRWLKWLESNPRLRVSLFYTRGSKTGAIGDTFYRARGGRLAVAHAAEGHCPMPASRLPALLEMKGDAGEACCEEEMGFEFEGEESAEGFVEEEGSGRSPLSVPPEKPIPFAPLPPAGSYWPVRTSRKDARTVSYMYQAPSGVVGRAGRMFLAGRTGERNGRKAARWHVGIDLFANVGDEVLACEDGSIVEFAFFYNAKSGERTYKLLVEHEQSGIVANYGEVISDSLARNGLKVGMRVSAGQVIAFVSDTSMLHFETYVKGTRTTHRWWKEDKVPPPELLNPSRYLQFLREHGLPLPGQAGAQSQPGGAKSAPPVPTAPAAKPAASGLPVLGAGAVPPSDPAAYRTFRLTTYHVVDQNDLPTASVRVPIHDEQGRSIAEGSPAFFAQLSLEGTARLSDGRLINVTGKTVPVSHDDYAEVLAHHIRAYAKRDKERSEEGKPPISTKYSGIVVESDRVVRAFAFHEVPDSRRGVGYGVQRGLPLVPFRTLAADIGIEKYAQAEPKWKGKGGLVPAGTHVYIKEYDGLRLPDGSAHDGRFIVNDTGGAIFGAHFDVFVGTRAEHKKVKLPESGQVWFAGIEQRIPPGYEYGLTA